MAAPPINKPAPPRMWRYSWDRVKNSPSVKAGMPSKEELALRRTTTVLMDNVGRELRMYDFALCHCNCAMEKRIAVRLRCRTAEMTVSFVRAAHLCASIARCLSL